LSWWRWGFAIVSLCAVGCSGEARGPDRAPSSLTISDRIEAVLIDLNISGAQSLFVLLAADGSINRTGDGSPGNQERDLFIGVTDPSSFRALLPFVREEWLKTPGKQYSSPKQRGLPCKLTLMFKTKDGDTSLEFLYGSESEGPPQEVALFVQAAIDLTKPWYEAQKRDAARK
jgi:hypothetical protein